MLFTLSFSIILIPLLQLLLEMVEVEAPVTEHMEDCLDSVSSLAFPSLQGSVFTQGRGSWQAWRFQSISSSPAVFASQVGCRKTDAKNAIIAGKSTKGACHSFLLQSTLFQGKLGLLLTYSVTRACTTPWETLPIWLYSSLSLKFLRTEASYLSLSTQYLVADIQWYLLNVE